MHPPTSPSDTEHGKALFLSGLSEDCEFTDLHKAFEPFGRVVLCRVLKDAKTGRSRRVGYVNFDNSEHARAAMTTLHGTPGPGGMPWDIKVAAHDPTFKAVETKRVFVRYVPVDVTLVELRTAFEQFGMIEDCTLSRDLSRTARKEPGPWNMAYVTFCKSADAVSAIARAASVIRFGEHELTVKPAVSEETLRLRSKNRQAARQPSPKPPMYGAGAAAGAGVQVVQAPPGMMPVMIPGVGLAFVPQGSVAPTAAAPPLPSAVLPVADARQGSVQHAEFFAVQQPAAPTSMPLPTRVAPTMFQAAPHSDMTGAPLLPLPGQGPPAAPIQLQQHTAPPLVPQPHAISQQLPAPMGPDHSTANEQQRVFAPGPMASRAAPPTFASVFQATGGQYVHAPPMSA